MNSSGQFYWNSFSIGFRKGRFLAAIGTFRRSAWPAAKQHDGGLFLHAADSVANGADKLPAGGALAKMARRAGAELFAETAVNTFR